jgi:threonine dehydrogenase-like Zn-dependent dehydrogenase
VTLFDNLGIDYKRCALESWSSPNSGAVMDKPTTMKAIRLDQAGKPLALETVPVPTLGPRDVLVRVEAAGLNGGDVHLAAQGTIPLRVRPITIGHEAAGTIAEIGAEVDRFRVGDRVHCDPVLSCLMCDNCMAGRRLACRSAGVMGMTYFGATEHGLVRFQRYAHGACAEYIKVPEENAERLSDRVPFDVACKFGVLGTGYRAVKTADVQPHHTVIVNCATGGTGAATLLSARFAGARRVIAVGRNRHALEQLKEKIGGPLDILCSSDDDMGARVTELTGGMGADSLIDYSPADTEIASQLIGYLKPGGRAVLGGGAGQKTIAVPYRTIMSKGVTIVGTHAYTAGDIRELDGLIAEKRLRVDCLITDRFPLSQTDAALQKMRKREGQPLWVIIDPSATS